MKFKLFLSALLLSVAMVGCNDNPLDESVSGGEIATRTITVDVNSDPEARVSVTTGDRWSFSWDGNESLIGWGDSAYSSKFTTSNSGSTVTFTGLMDYESTNICFIYPYRESIINGGSLTFDLSTQKIDMTDESVYTSMANNNLYLISNSRSVTANESFTMSHIFTYLELAIDATDLLDEELIIEKIVISGLAKSSATKASFDDEDSVVADSGDVITINVENATALTADGLIIPVVAPVFTLAVNQEATITIYFEDGYATINKTYTAAAIGTSVDVVTNDGTVLSLSRADIAVAGQEYKAGEYNTVSASFSIADDYVNTKLLPDGCYYLSAFAANTSEETIFVPEEDTWTIYIDADIEDPTYADFEGLKYAIYSANGGDDYNSATATAVKSPKLVFPALETLPDYAFYSHTTALAGTDGYFQPYYLDFSVSLPAAKTIGSGAFWGCNKFATLTDLGKLEAIHGSAFRNCTALTDLDLPSVTSVGEGTLGGSAFRGATAMLNISLPETTTLSGTFNFGGATGLKTLSLPKVTAIDYNSTYYNTNLTSYVIGSEDYPVTIITKYAFNSNGTDGIDVSPTLAALTITTADASLCNYTIDGNVLKLYTDTEKNDETLTEITFKTINGDGATLNEGEYYLSSFEGNTASATDIFYPTTNDDVWTIVDYEIYTLNGETAPADIKASYQIIDCLERAIAAANTNGIYPTIIFSNLTAVPVSAFQNATDTTSAQDYINNTLVYSIEMPRVTSVGPYAFQENKSLKSISLPLAESIGQSAFRTCSSLTTLSLPEVTTIGTSVTYSFAACTSLTEVYLPKVTALGNNAFNGSSKLAKLTLGTDGDGCITALSINGTGTANTFNSAPTTSIELLIGFADSCTNAYINDEAWKLSITDGTNTNVITFKSINGESEPVVDGEFYIANIDDNTAVPESQTWTILDTTISAGSATLDPLAGLKTLIKKAQNYGENSDEGPNIIFQGITGKFNQYLMPASSGNITNTDTTFAGYKFSVELPYATEIGHSVFQGASLTAISAPLVATLGYGSLCDTALTELELPKLTTLGNISFGLINNTTVTLKTVKLGLGGDGILDATKNPMKSQNADAAAIDWSDTTDLYIKISEANIDGTEVSNDTITWTTGYTSIFRSITTYK